MKLYIKNDAVNMPTLSFKDRVVSVALTTLVNWGSQLNSARLGWQIPAAVLAQLVRLLRIHPADLNR